MILDLMVSDIFSTQKLRKIVILGANELWPFP